MNNGNGNGNGNLTSRAMLVNLSIKSWTPVIADKRVQREVADTHNASQEAVTVKKELIDRKNSTYSTFQKAMTAARDEHYKLTLPWNDNGTRVLPSKAFLDYTAAIRKHKAIVETAFQDFVTVLEDLIEDGKRRLGTMGDSDEYPTRQKIMKRFSFTTDFLPLPETADFRVSLADDEIQDIKNSAEDHIKASMRELWQRLYDKVNKMQETLADPKAIFRDTLVKNIVELTDLLPKLNYAGDEDLDRMTETVKDQLTNYRPDELRDSPRARQETADKARAIADQMRAFMGEE